MLQSASQGGLDLIPLNFQLGCGPGPDPPQFPPWCGPIRRPLPRADMHPLDRTPARSGTPRRRHPLEQTPPRSRHPPGADTLLEQIAPWEQTPPRSRYPPRADTPLWRSTARHTGIPPAMHAGIHTAPSPVNRMTDTCKNITLATTSLRPVIIHRLDQGLSPGHLLSCQPL